MSKQMNALATNIATLRRIEKTFGSLDQFVASSNPADIAAQLSKAGPHKLRHVGPALALEYLRNIGIRAAKPDLHVRRILGGERLAYFVHYPSEQETVAMVAQLAAEINSNPTYLDNLLWLYCADGCGEVCGAKPRCSICTLRNDRRFPERDSRC